MELRLLTETRQPAQAGSWASATPWATVGRTLSKVDAEDGLAVVQVAEARSDETFVALCLLTVTGASLLTQKLGFSDTMGAFVAGVLLAETNYSTQARSPHCLCLEPTLRAPSSL